MGKKLPVPVGQIFGRLTTTGRAILGGRDVLWECVCACGAICTVAAGRLRVGHKKSCGCLKISGHKDRPSKRVFDTPTYRSWRAMVNRCHRIGDGDYPRYGAKGIVVCERWRKSFSNFISDMGERPSGTTIDRKDNSKGYSPENCRWATITEQNRNKTNHHYVTIDGETKILSEWAELYNIHFHTVHARIRNGWDVERAIKEPLHHGHRGFGR